MIAFNILIVGVSARRAHKLHQPIQARFSLISTLDVSECLLTDVAIQAFAQRVNTRCSYVSPGGLPQSCSLYQIDVSGCVRITHNSLLELVELVPSIERIYYAGCYYVQERALSSPSLIVKVQTNARKKVHFFKHRRRTQQKLVDCYSPSKYSSNYFCAQ